MDVVFIEKSRNVAWQRAAKILWVKVIRLDFSGLGNGSYDQMESPSGVLI